MPDPNPNSISLIIFSDFGSQETLPAHPGFFFFWDYQSPCLNVAQPRPSRSSKSLLLHGIQTYPKHPPAVHRTNLEVLFEPKLTSASTTATTLSYPPPPPP
eukprot:scaffold20170_cov114-Cylindrotheca_fusiformis.AAC.2